MDAKDILTLIAVILLLPVGAYLREQTYRNVHGNATIGRDIESLIDSFKKWRRERAWRKELKRKYNHLNKKQDEQGRAKENHR